MKSPNHNVFDFLFEAGLALMVTALVLMLLIVVANLVLALIAAGALQLSTTVNQLTVGAAVVCLLLSLIFFVIAIYKS